MNSEPQSGSYIWFLKSTPIFEDQTESIYQSADYQATACEFRRGDVLSLVGTSQKYIFVIIEGQVKLRSHTESGKEIILDIMGQGDAFGPIHRALAAAPKDNHPGAMATEAVALTDVQALRYDSEYFTDLVKRRPTIIVNLSRILGLRQQRMELRLARLLYRSSLGKVAGLLSELGERFGTREGDKITLNVKLTHQEMASIVGCKRETVSESLAELEYLGLIEASRSKISLLQPDKLDGVQ